MSKTYICICVIFIWFSSLFSQDNWKRVRRTWYRPLQFRDIFFLRSTQYGWAVGAKYDTTDYHHMVAYTSDGGNNWIPQFVSEATYKLHSVFFTDSLQGWVVGTAGNGGVVLHTEDGGGTWATQSLAANVVDNVYFINKNKGWAGCYYGEILHTSDGGQTWNVQYTLPDASWIEEIFFTDSLTGYLVSDIPGNFPPARAYKTTNGGQSWFQLSISFSIVEEVWTLNFYNSNIGWIGTSYGIHSTTNGGTTWSYYSLPTDDYILAIDFIDSLRGWAVGGDFEIAESDVYYTTDGGQTWIEVYCPRHNELWGVSATDRNNVWVAGWRGVIMHSSDGGITWEYQVGPGDDLISIDAPDTLNIWAGGGYGTLIHSPDGGYNWEVVDPGINSYIYGVSFPTANQGWVVGGRNSVRHTSDGGLTWQIQDPANYHWMTVDFVDTLNGWIAGYMTDHYVIYHTTDGGNTWSLQYQVPTLISIAKLHFFNADIGWAVGGDYGAGGKVLRTTDGGQTWEMITVPVPAPAKIYDIDAVTSTYCWAVSHTGTLLRTDDGGLTWNTYNDTTIGTTSLYTVDFVDRNNGWVIGGGAFRTRDGGATWSKDSGGVGTVDIVYIDIVAKDTLYAWVCAGRGRVWRYSGSVGIGEVEQIKEISALSLYVLPNPCTENPLVKYFNPLKQEVEIVIYDISGRRLRTLCDGVLDAGMHDILWNRKNYYGEPVAQGIYFLFVKTENLNLSKKVVLIKGGNQ